MSNNHPRNTVLLILVDAFSQVYFKKEYTPFLWSVAQEGASFTLNPIFAFRGIETTIFTGVWPCVHNVWTEFKLAQHLNDSRKDRLLQQIVRPAGLLPTDDLRAKSRFFIERIVFKKYYKTLNLVPPRAMQYFETAQSKDTCEPRSVGNVTTIFDVFRKTGIRYAIIEPSVTGDKGVQSRMNKIINQNNTFNFFYLKLNQLDHAGHKFGPAPSMFKAQLAKIDQYIEQTLSLLRKKNPHLKVLILADHGMSHVHTAINILESLRDLRSKPYEDYVFFADSTMIRFWFFHEKARTEVSDFLQQFKFGHVLSASEKNSLKIPTDPSYGQVIYVVDEGHLIRPSFFCSKSETNGMHGYAYPKTPQAIPIAMMNDYMAEHSPEKEIKFTDLRDLILCSLFPGKVDRICT